MFRKMGLGLSVGLVALAFVVTTASAQTKDTMKCQQINSKAGVKFVGAQQKCVNKCEKAARKGLNPYEDCEPPYGAATEDCIVTAAGKALALIAKACAAECPTCYAGGDCTTYANDNIADLRGQVDLFVGLIVCDPDSEAGDKLINKCIDGTAKNLAKFVGGKSKCYQKCIGLEFKGKIPAGGCVPPSPTDPKTAECITKAEDKAQAGIAKVCPSGTEPGCWAVASTSWVPLVQSAVDSAIPQTFCGSPSGAFLD